MIKFPRHSLDLVGRTDDEGEHPTSGVQFAVLFPDGKRVAYGDQSWVAYGTCLKDLPAGCRIEQRSVSITYGAWSAVTPPEKCSCGVRVQRCPCNAVGGEHWVDAPFAVTKPGQFCQPSGRYCPTSRVGGQAHVAHKSSRAAVEE